MKTLIVATDFSKEAENAVEYACAAAQHLNTNVILFNSYTIPLHVSNARLPASVFNELLENNNLLLRNRASELSEEYSIEVNYESSFLQLNDKLETLFSKYDAAMVIMGTAVQSLGQDLFGNTNTTTILKLKFPVLAIPMNATFKPIKKILFACDVLRGINIRILEEVKTFAHTMGAEVELFHVQNKLRNLGDTLLISDNTDQINEGLEGVSHTYKPIESDTVIDEIKNEITQINADLLIMVPQRYGFWKSLVHRSKTRTMASLSEIPLLSIRI
jgi:nucleotide-binding universal stress UspA family protein